MSESLASTRTSRAVGALPPRARVFHIGLAKTGTTALQSTARNLRADLLAHGVRYPGEAMNHREAVSSFMGRRWGWIGPGARVPSKGHWQRLMREVESENERRVWISHEFASESDDENAARFVEALGPQLHVVVTLRPLGAMLASSWQQYLKSGITHTFEHWLREVLADPPNQKVTPSFHRRNDQAGVIRRWVDAAGTDHVTAVVVDKAQPTQLTEAFETLFDLPPGFLVDKNLGGLAANRSMSLAESELARRVNLVIKKKGVDWSEYAALVRDGGIARMLQTRTPEPDEERLELPRWAAERATELASGYVEAIAGSGIRVIGDLDVLARPVPGNSEGVPTLTSVPIKAATAFIGGTVSAGSGRGAFFRERPATAVVSTVAAASTRDLVTEIGVRVSRRARQRLRGLRR